MNLFKIVLLPIIFLASVCAQNIPLPGPTPYAPPLPPFLSFTASVTQTGSAGGVASGRTYTGLNIGTAAANRTIIVVNGFRDAGNCPLSSLTVGGITATRQQQQTNSVTNTTITSIWTADVPTGTTATIVTTYCASVDSAEGLCVYAAYGLASDTPGATNGSNSATAPALSVNTVSNGMVIAGSWSLGQPNPAIAWTGVTSDADFITDPTSSNQVMDCGSASHVVAATPRTVSGTYANSCGSFECAASTAAFH